MKISKRNKKLPLLITFAAVLILAVGGVLAYNFLRPETKEEPVAYRDNDVKAPENQNKLENGSGQDEGKPDNTQAESPLEEASNISATMTSWGQHENGEVYVNLDVNGAGRGAKCELVLEKDGQIVTLDEEVVLVPPAQTYGCFFNVASSHVSSGEWLAQVTVEYNDSTTKTQQEKVGVE